MKPSFRTFFNNSIGLALGGLLMWGCALRTPDSDSQPISHDIWDGLLRRHVDSLGQVDYRGFIADSNALDSYLELLSQNLPNNKHWQREEQLAYWINAYNAFTVKLIVDHYPVASIKDIKRGIPFVNDVWEWKFFSIEGRRYNLNNIEHGIIRAHFDEPRIHFAVNCASFSCPDLRAEAYVADRLDAQLDEQARRFLSDPRKNRLSPQRAELSKIFDWYGGDFTKTMSKLAFIQQYSPVALQPDADIVYLDYDWRLNDKAR